MTDEKNKDPVLMAANILKEAEILTQTYKPDEVKAILNMIQGDIPDVIENIDIINREAYKKIFKIAEYVLTHVKEVRAGFERFNRLQPYIKAEMAKPENQGSTFMGLLKTDVDRETGAPIHDSRLEAILKAAMSAELAAMPKVTVKERGVAKVEYPLDKINNKIWTVLSGRTNEEIPFAMEKRGSSKEANAIYSINFDALKEEQGLTITKELTVYDKRIYNAASALFNNGFKTCTVKQIYAAMGNNGSPSANVIKRINDSLTKMSAARIHIDNTDEHEVYKRCKKFVYDASLLPMERVRAIVNGKVTDSAIHLFREPPLVTFAKERKQITAFNRQLLASPISKTDASLLLEDYLLTRISSMKNSKGKLSNKLLYSTIYEKSGITTGKQNPSEKEKEKKQKQRAKGKITKYLDHFKKCGFIKNFTEVADGVIIRY